MIAKTVKLSVTNCCLLKADKGYILIDMAHDWEWTAVCKPLEKIGVGFGDLECQTTVPGPRYWMQVRSGFRLRMGRHARRMSCEDTSAAVRRAT